MTVNNLSARLITIKSVKVLSPYFHMNTVSRTTFLVLFRSAGAMFTKLSLMIYTINFYAPCPFEPFTLLRSMNIYKTASICQFRPGHLTQIIVMWTFPRSFIPLHSFFLISYFYLSYMYNTCLCRTLPISSFIVLSWQLERS